MAESNDSTSKIVLIVPNHSITGELILEDLRLSDFLNDERQSYLELRNATVSRLAEPSRILSGNPLALIPKDKVVMAFELATGGAANAKRLYRYRRKARYTAVLVAEDIEVRGYLHGMTTGSLLDLVMKREDRFLPVTSAVVTFAANSTFGATRDAVVVNTRHLEYFALGEPEATEEPSRKL